MIRKCLLAAVLSVGLLPAVSQAADFSLRLIGSQTIPTGMRFEGVEFGGISGLDRAADGSFFAISDDRGGERGAPRFYNLSLTYDVNAFTGVTLNSQTFMRRPDGSRFPTDARTVDPESIRVAPNGNLYWTSEGNWSSDPTARHQPFVREMTVDGAFVREFNTPAMFRYVDNRSTGGRDNLLFESLAVTPNGTLYTANEDALIQDGSLASLKTGSLLRVTAIDPVSGNAGAQYAYPLPKVPVEALFGSSLGAVNGLAELLAVDDRRFIALERAFALGVGNTIRLVSTTIDADTTDVSGFASLQGARFTPMRREVILEMPITYQGVTLDNVEALCWGKTLANGNRSLVLAADNNFSSRQTTLFLVFEVLGSAPAAL